MSEVEGLTESSEEHIHHAAHGGGPKWISAVALSTAILATLAAICALLSGGNETEALLHQEQASNKWAYYQAKGIKSYAVQGEITTYTVAGKPVPPELPEQAAKYKEEQKEIFDAATDLETEKDFEMHSHHIYAPAITLFQVAIAIGAISVLTKRRRYFAFSLAFGIAGLACFLTGVWVQFVSHAVH
jgi:hypothetical protein